MKFWDYGNSFLLESSRAGAKVGYSNKFYYLLTPPIKFSHKFKPLILIPFSYIQVLKEGETTKFIYPSYVQDIMGDIFSLGFGPFRWVCTSGDPEDLRKSDKIAESVIQDLLRITPKEIQFQFNDNLKWIQKAEENRLVVGSQARILYLDTQGRT